MIYVSTIYVVLCTLLYRTYSESNLLNRQSTVVTNDMDSQQSRRLIVTNIGETTAEDISMFFKLHRDQQTKENSAVEISKNSSGRIALIHIPEEIFPEAFAKNGLELAGNVIQVKDPAQAAVLPPSS